MNTKLNFLPKSYIASMLSLSSYYLSKIINFSIFSSFSKRIFFIYKHYLL